MHHRTKDYEIRLAGGPVPVDLIAGISDVDEVAERRSSVLLCHLEDQAELHGLLARIALLGLDVVEVRAIPDLPDPPAASICGAVG